MELKTCTKCQRALPLAEFYRDERKLCGRRPACRDCVLKTNQAWRLKPGSKEITAAGSRRYVDRHRHITRVVNRASAAVRGAISEGLLVRPSICSKCGKEAKIEAAHDDYSKPLEVRWLCISCHRRWDRAQPKIAERVA